MLISIIDYGTGNLKSIQNAFRCFKADCIISDDKNEIESSDGIILPGVGAFPDAMENMIQKGLDKTVVKCRNEGIPILGICLGMQLMFEEGEEVRRCKGLSLFKGKIVKLDTDFKIPHMGWNTLNIKKESKLLNHIKEGEHVYFVHSYYALMPHDNILASADYGMDIPAAVGSNNVFGVQFHPEKSGDAGLTILKNFIEITKMK